MNTTLEERVAALEEHVSLLAAAVEGRRRPGPGPQPQGFATPTAGAVPMPEPDLDERPVLPRSEVPARPAVELEDLLGRRLLALVGGLALVLGIAFFVALTIDRGWIGETARVLLAAAGSGALLAGGIWLYERKGRTQAALAVTAAAIAGLFLTLAAAAMLYELVPLRIALLLAFALGAGATALAVRWDARTIAGLGIGGTLVAPTLANALTTPGMGFLAIAMGSAASVLVWRRWRWLHVGAFLLTFAQVVAWAATELGDAQLVVMLTLFAALNLAAALGHELRDRAAKVEPAAALLVVFGPLILGAVGYFGLPHNEGELAGGLWLVALAVAHAGLGVVALAARRASEDIGLILVGAAVVLGNVAAGLLAEGWPLAVGWAASAAAAAAGARRYTQRRELIELTLGAQLALSVGHVLLFDAPPGLLAPGHDSVASAVGALAAVVVAAFASARLIADQRERSARVVLDALAMVSLAYATALSLDGVALLVAWAGAAASLARTAGRLRDRLAGLGAAGFVALMAAHILALEAPPTALGYGAGSLPEAVVGLALIAAAIGACRRNPIWTLRERTVFDGALAAALVYLGSIAIVTSFQPGADAIATALDVGVRQQGQVLLSAFWSVCGFAALWLGLRRDSRLVRLGGLGLLGLAVAKVFFYDLSTLASINRVASFVALGLLLLTAAFAYQRLRAPASG